MKEFYIYHDRIPKVGGIETAVYNLSKALGKKGYDVTVLYNSVENPSIVLHYAEVANIKKLLPEDNIECDICLIASNHQIPNQIKAKRYLQWIHSDYRKYPIKLKNKGKVEYIAVSKHCAKVIKGLENVDAKVIYNLVDDDFGADKRRVLKLVSNTRISYEKGMDRMLVFAKKLKEKGVRFVWLVCGDNTWNPRYFEETRNKFKDIEEVYFVGYKRDITVGLEMADYLVQLSDFEGCPLSILEALKMGVPCIVTGWGGVNELVKEGENGYILDMQLSDLDKKLDLILNKIPKFEYKPLSGVEDWIDLIGEVKDSKKRKKGDVKVLIIKNYFDTVLREKIKQGVVREVDVERAKQLANAGVGEIIEMSKLR